MYLFTGAPASACGLRTLVLQGCMISQHGSRPGFYSPTVNNDNNKLPRSASQRFEFFSPIWRVMRDDNVTVDDVAQQVGAFTVLHSIRGDSSLSQRPCPQSQLPRMYMLQNLMRLYDIYTSTLACTPPQVAYVALAVKQGSQVSDMRHHRCAAARCLLMCKNCFLAFAVAGKAFSAVLPCAMGLL